MEHLRFRRECKAAGKKLMVWTVNDRRQMMEVSAADDDNAKKVVDVLYSGGSLAGECDNH